MANLRSESGFTLLELLISIGVVSVLAAVALPNFYSSKEKAYDSEAKTILRKVAMAEEAYFLTNEKYIACDQISCPTLLNNIGDIPKDIVLEISTDGYSYSGIVSHKKGSGSTFKWN